MKCMTLPNQQRLSAWRQRYHAATGTHPDVAAHLHQRRRGVNWRARHMFPCTQFWPSLWDWYPLDTHNTTSPPGHLPLIERRSGERDD